MGQTVRVIHCLPPHKEQKVEDALNQRDQIDYECFLKLQQLLPFVDSRDPEVVEAVKQAEELIRKRDQANHNFLAALTLKD
jgi:hypothetical protein